MSNEILRIRIDYSEDSTSGPLRGVLPSRCLAVLPITNHSLFTLTMTELFSRVPEVDEFLEGMPYEPCLRLRTQFMGREGENPRISFPLSFFANKVRSDPIEGMRLLKPEQELIRLPQLLRGRLKKELRLLLLQELKGKLLLNL